MKGVLMNVVEEAVSAEWGDDMWDDLLADCDLQGAYTALGNYSDAELIELAEAASARLDAPLDDVVRILGRLSFPPLIGRYPVFLEGVVVAARVPPAGQRHDPPRGAEALSRRVGSDVRSA